MNHVVMTNAMQLMITNMQRPVGGNDPCGNFSDCSSRISSIKIFIEPAVESHRGAARKHHAKHHQARILSMIGSERDTAFQ